MTTQAAIGYGAKFELENAPASGVFVRIAEIDDITPPSPKADQLDATNMDSPNGYKEFILGMTDPGEVKLSMNLVPGSPSETLLLAAQASRAAYAAKITFPGAQVWAFQALVIEYAPAVPTDKKMTATVTAKVTGSVVRT